MRKAAIIFVVLFVGAFLIGMTTSSVMAAKPGGGDGDCFYSCDCAGNPIYCCPVPGGVSCKQVLFGIECPQVYDC